MVNRQILVKKKRGKERGTPFAFYPLTINLERGREKKIFFLLLTFNHSRKVIGKWVKKREGGKKEKGR